MGLSSLQCMSYHMLYILPSALGYIQGCYLARMFTITETKEIEVEFHPGPISQYSNVEMYTDIDRTWDCHQFSTCHTTCYIYCRQPWGIMMLLLARMFTIIDTREIEVEFHPGPISLYPSM